MNASNLPRTMPPSTRLFSQKLRAAALNLIQTSSTSPKADPSRDFKYSVLIARHYGRYASPVHYSWYMSVQRNEGRVRYGGYVVDLTICTPPNKITYIPDYQYNELADHFPIGREVLAKLSRYMESRVNAHLPLPDSVSNSSPTILHKNSYCRFRLTIPFQDRKDMGDIIYFYMPRNNILTESYMGLFTHLELGPSGSASRLNETLLPFLDELNILWARFMTEVS
jgi:hypothetical protein